MTEGEINLLIERLKAEGRYNRLRPIIKQWTYETSREEAYYRVAKEFPPIAKPIELPPLLAEEVAAKEAESPPKKKRQAPSSDSTDEPPVSPKDERDYRAAIDWVAAHMEDREASRENAPSAAAWGMFVWAKESDANRTKFYTDLLPKVLPTKQQIEREARFHDDGRILKLVEDMLKSMDD